MPPAGVKISLVSPAGAAGMKPLLAPPIEHDQGVHCLGLDFSFARAIIKQTALLYHIYYGHKF